MPSQTLDESWPRPPAGPPCRDAAWRSAAKAVSYKAISASMTAGFAYSLTGSQQAALALGAFELVLKLGFFYVHERVWERIPAGRAGASGRAT